MTEHVRSTALSLACTLVACSHGAEPVALPIAVPGAIAEIEADNGTLQIFPVAQLTPIETSEWRFEPGSRRFSSTEFGDCSIWDVETGRLIHSFEQATEPAEPCNDWLPAEYLFAAPDISTDGRLQLDTTSGLEIFDVQTGKLLRALPCPDCATSTAITWARTGHQLAVAWDDPAHVEIWDADTGTRVRAEQIPVTLIAELDQLELGWTEGGATVMWTELGFAIECTEYDEDCYYDEDEQVMMLRPVTRHALLLGPASKSVIAIGQEAGFEDVLFDAEGRWVFWRYEWSERRAGTTMELHFEGLAGQGSGLGWQTFESYDDYAGSMTREGMWRNDGATHWAASIIDEDHEMTPVGVGWETIITSPPLGRRAGMAIEELEWGTEVWLDVFGIVGDTLRVSGEACVEGGCTPLGVAAPPGCELLDVASGHASELLDCGGELFLRNGGGTKRLPHDPAALEWWWSRGGALVLDDGSMFTLLDAASGVGGLQRNDSITVFEGRLGLEIERLVLMTDLGLEVVDLRTAKVVANFPDVFPDDVAFSPTGDRLALLGDGQIRVLSLPGGETLASWPVDMAAVAFRQDGKAIFAGMDGPAEVFDAATGQLLDPELLTPLNEALGWRGELDPSWRWIMNDESKQLVRTLDGLMLTWREDGAWLPATGQYQGKGPGPEIAYRVGGDVLAVPEFDAADLAKWLQRDDLAELFLAGQAIPTPSMTAGELAGVRAVVEGKKKR